MDIHIISEYGPELNLKIQLSFQEAIINGDIYSM